MVANIKKLSQERQEGMCIYTMGEIAGDLDQEEQNGSKKLKPLSKTF